MANPTFTDMMAQIADELNRTDLSNQASIAIVNAIAHYQGERWYWNEDRTKTFSISSSQEYYTSVDLTTMEQLLEIDSLVINTSATDRYELTERTWDWFELHSTSSSATGRPTDYVYYQQRLRLYPVPNGGAVIRVAGTFRQTSISASCSNEWFHDAAQMIKHHAKAELYEVLLFDFPKADRMRLREFDEAARLRRETNRRIATGTITATQF